MKKRNRKGFTLAELLIVVAIIAVLVAIAVPVFSARLEKAREAVCMANRRSLYGQVVTEHITSDVPYKNLFDIYVGSAGKCPSGGTFSWQDQGDTGVVICSYHDGGGGGSGGGSGTSSVLHTTPNVARGERFKAGDVISDETGTAVIAQGMEQTWNAYNSGTKVADLVSQFGSDAIMLNASVIKEDTNDLQPNDVFYNSADGKLYYVKAYNQYDNIPNGGWIELNQ